MQNPNDDHLEKTAKVIADAITGAIDEKYLFEPNNKIESKQHVLRYLDTLQNRQAIALGLCNHVFQPTWEYFYPNMAERLLAIEAAEKFGSEFILHEDIQPPQTIGYPYQKEYSYGVRVTENDGSTYSEFLESFSYKLDFEEEKTLIPQYENCKTIELYCLYRWFINNPEGMLIAEMSIQSIKPVEFISFSATIEENNCTFQE